MKKLYCVICGKYRKFEKPKKSYLLEKTIVVSKCKNEDCSKCKNEDRRINWDIKNSWLNWKIIIALKIGEKKT